MITSERPPCDMGCDDGPGWELLIMVLILMIVIFGNIQAGDADAVWEPAVQIAAII